jgi:hypothetical protein
MQYLRHSQYQTTLSISSFFFKCEREKLNKHVYHFYLEDERKVPGPSENY